MWQLLESWILFAAMLILWGPRPCDQPRQQSRTSLHPSAATQAGTEKLRDTHHHAGALFDALFSCRLATMHVHSECKSECKQVVAISKCSIAKCPSALSFQRPRIPDVMKSPVRMTDSRQLPQPCSGSLLRQNSLSPPVPYKQRRMAYIS